MSRTIPYRFNKKHLRYIRRCRYCTLNVAEGAVRAGKTVDNLFAFADALDSTPDRLHLATGSTAATAKLILGDGAGFGLCAIFRGRCKYGKYLGCECLRVTDLAGKEKIVLFAGGRNADSYKRIRGFTIGLWIATEIDLHHPTMISEALNRQLAAKDRRIFWDLNPAAPSHFIYTMYLDRYAAQQQAGTLPEHFYNYEHFTIFDNPAVSSQRRREIIAEYDKGSFRYRRDIEGVRCAAEGLVYPLYADRPERYAFSEEEAPFGLLRYIHIGIDFGGNRSRTTFVATALTEQPAGGGKGGDRFGRGLQMRGCEQGKKGLAVLLEHAIDGRKGEIDAGRLCREFTGFYRQLTALYPGVEIRGIYCDSEAQYLINSLRRACREAGIGTVLRDAKKERILSRIACVSTLLSSGRLWIARRCKMLSAGLCGAVWEAEGERRKDDFTSDIDILDAFEYSFEGLMQQLV